MSIFLIPNNLIPMCYFFVPQVLEIQTPKTLNQDMETPSNVDAEILKSISE